MPGFIELTFAFGVKRLVAVDCIRRVDRREGYETAQIICERGFVDLHPHETYAEIVGLIRDALTVSPPQSTLLTAEQHTEAE